MTRLLHLISSTAAVSARSSMFFASRGTIVVALFLTPMLDVAFAVLMGASVNSPNLILTSYRGALVTAALITCTALCMEFVVDREQGMLNEILSRRVPNIGYWIGLSLPAAAVGIITGGVTIVAIFVVDAARSAELMLHCMALLPMVIIGGVGLGVLCAGVGLFSQDPYMALNFVTPVIPITSGVVVPLSYYPKYLAAIFSGLPISTAINDMYAVNRAWGATFALEAGKSMFCMILGLLAVTYIARRQRVK